MLCDGWILKDNGKPFRDEWEELLSPIDKMILFSFSRDTNNSLNKSALSIINQLNKKGFETFENKKINSTIYIAKKDKDKKGTPCYVAALYVVNQHICIIEGRFTKEQLDTIISTL